MHGPLPDLRQCVSLKEFAWVNSGAGSHSKGVSGETDEMISLRLSSLRKLESLTIFDGSLGVTTFLASLINLRRLYLCCDFRNFPEGFEKLNKLEEIDIRGAKSLKALPKYLGHLPALQSLSLMACGVKSLPKSVRERKDLYIYVRH